MGDIQEYFVQHNVRNFYSVSISRLSHRRGRREPDLASSRSRSSNGFTFVEAYLARGMHIDDFAPNLSFFFCNGMDPGVLGDRPRRAAHLGGGDARTLRRQRAQPEAQVPLQTSGRSLHAQEIAFNDIRTTLQALIAIYDNSQLAAHQRLRRGDHHADRGERAPRDGDPADHQPRMGPREEREPEPGRFIIEELTDLVEEAVLKEFEAIASAAACSARWRPATSAARSRKSRCTTSTRSTTARTRSSASTRSAIRTAMRCRRRSSSRARPTRRSSRSSRACADFHARNAGEAPAALARLQQAVIDERQRLRGADGRRARAARSARSRTRCSRSAGSTGGACSPQARRQAGPAAQTATRGKSTGRARTPP